jgi:Amt family ammonium transporter
VAIVATIVFSGVMTFILVKALGLIVQMRATIHEEGIGLDVSQHGEEAYSSGEGAVLIVADEGGVR